jgi:hypothetical protein
MESVVTVMVTDFVCVLRLELREVRMADETNNEFAPICVGDCFVLV